MDVIYRKFAELVYPALVLNMVLQKAIEKSNGQAHSKKKGNRPLLVEKYTKGSNIVKQPFTQNLDILGLDPTITNSVKVPPLQAYKHNKPLQDRLLQATHGLNILRFPLVFLTRDVFTSTIVMSANHWSSGTHFFILITA